MPASPHAHPSSPLATARGLMSADGPTIALTPQLTVQTPSPEPEPGAAEDPPAPAAAGPPDEAPETTPEQKYGDLPGKVYVFQLDPPVPGEGSYKQTQEISPPLGEQD